MRALIVIDVQNEFSMKGLRPVPDHAAILSVIHRHVADARENGYPIAWIRHHNLPSESPAFIPGSWGAGFSPGFGPKPDHSKEVEFQKNVYGAFTGTKLGSWLSRLGITEILVAGFYTHGCVSTTCREAIMAGLEVVVDPEATGACDITHIRLGNMTAEEVRRSALLQLVNMGAQISSPRGQEHLHQRSEHRQ